MCMEMSLSELQFSSQTLMNPKYGLTIPTVWVLTVLSGGLALVVAGGSHTTLAAACRPRQPPILHVPTPQLTSQGGM